MSMSVEEAQSIAVEVLHQLILARTGCPLAYEWIMDQIDICDDCMDDALAVLQ